MKKILLAFCILSMSLAFAKDPVDGNAPPKDAKQATEATANKETATEKKARIAEEKKAIKAKKEEDARKAKEAKESAAKEKSEKIAKAKEDKETLTKEKSEKAAKAKDDKETIAKEKSEKAAKVKDDKETIAKEKVTKQAPTGKAAADGAAARNKIGDLKPGPNDLDKNGKQLTSQQMKMKECSSMGKGRNQEDFRSFMSECLKND